MRINQVLFVALAGAGLLFAGAASASATPWQAAHPRRVEVNHRLENQHARIDRDLRQGRIGPRQAATLHHEDHMIRREERRDARVDNGHITRGEQARINQQENRASGQIYRAAH